METRIENAVQTKNISELKIIVQELEKEISHDNISLLKYCLSNLAIIDSEHSIDYMHQAYKYDQNDASILNNLGFLYHNCLKDYTKAVNFYQKAIHINKKLSQAYRGIIDIFNSLDQQTMVYHYAKLGLEHCDDPFLWLHYGTYMNKHNVGSRNDILSVFQNGLRSAKKNDAIAFLYQNMSSVE